jgi:hypothetical protein
VVPVGPIQIKVELPKDVHGNKAKLLVGGRSISGRRSQQWLDVELPSVAEHEVLIFE